MYHTDNLHELLLLFIIGRKKVVPPPKSPGSRNPELPHGPRRKAEASWEDNNGNNPNNPSNPDIHSYDNHLMMSI